MAWSQRQIIEHPPQHVSPSHRRHSELRAMHFEIKQRDLQNQVTEIQRKIRTLNLKREERLRLDGYFRDNANNMASTDEIHTLHLADKNGIAVSAFNLSNCEYIRGEKLVDMVTSKGEQVIPLDCESKEIEYPNLDLRSGDVLRDPKIHYVSPALRRRSFGM